MRRFIVSFAFLAGTALLAPAQAGPLEDGVKAYTRAEYGTAVRLLRPLAEQGNIDALVVMAGMYQRGSGVDEDKVKAYVYFAVAANKGDKEAASDRDALGKELTADQLQNAKQQAADWKPSK